MRRLLLVSTGLGLLLGGGSWAQKAPPTEEPLPEIGTLLAVLPPGPGKAIAQEHCLRCHSADVLRQQRLTEKQWTANVTKMVGWGAEVPEADRPVLAAYLFRNFGPDNHFDPVVTKPLTKK